MRFLRFEPEKLRLPAPEQTLPGREQEVQLSGIHLVLGTPLRPPFPAGTEQAVFGMGCFWGAERIFWQSSGVHTSAVGYAGGTTPNPSYDEVCSGLTGHTEAVLVVFDPSRTTYAEMLRLFWESHDPTQGMRQGNDVGTQYRSALYWFTDRQEREATESLERYQERLTASGYAAITTEIGPAPTFYYAEEYHQQYLARNPRGYCGIRGTGVVCPVDLGT